MTKCNERQRLTSSSRFKGLGILVLAPLLVVGWQDTGPAVIDFGVRDGDLFETRVAIDFGAASDEQRFEDLHPQVTAGDSKLFQVDLKITSSSQTLITGKDASGVTSAQVAHGSIQTLGDLFAGRRAPKLRVDDTVELLPAALQLDRDPETGAWLRSCDWGKPKPTARELAALAGAPTCLEVFGLLPSADIKIGETWDVDGAAWVGALFPFGDYSFGIESTLAGFGTDPEGERYDHSFLARPVSGSATGEFLSRSAVDGQDMLQFAYEYDLIVDVPLCSLVDDLVATFGPGGWGLDRRIWALFGTTRLEATLEGTALLNWDVKQRLIHSLDMKFDFKGELATPFYCSLIERPSGEYVVGEAPAGSVHADLSGEGHVLLNMVRPKE